MRTAAGSNSDGNEFKVNPYAVSYFKKIRISRHYYFIMNIVTKQIISDN